MEQQDIWLQLRAQIDTLVLQAAAGDARLESFLRRNLENWAINRGSGRMIDVKARLKKVILEQQGGVCAICSEPLPPKGWELDRLSADFHDDTDQGYRLGNVQGVHAHCHVRGPRPAGRRPAIP